MKQRCIRVFFSALVIIMSVVMLPTVGYAEDMEGINVPEDIQTEGMEIKALADLPLGNGIL